MFRSFVFLRTKPDLEIFVAILFLIKNLYFLKVLVVTSPERCAYALNAQRLVRLYGDDQNNNYEENLRRQTTTNNIAGMFL